MNIALADSDVAAMLRIAGEIGELEPDLHLRRTHILDGLLGLVGACGAACSEIDPRQINDSGWATSETITLAGALTPHEKMIRQYLTGQVAALDPCIPHLLGKGKAVVTFRRADVMDRSWYRSQHFNELRRPRGFGESLYAAFSTPDGRRLKLTLHRELHDPLFTEREVRLLHIFNQNLSRLYSVPPRAHVLRDHSSRPNPRIEALAPRLRPVLRSLLAGDSEKQVASKTGLSPHTVHSYTKDLYRTFGANSRGELLAQFIVNQ